MKVEAIDKLIYEDMKRSGKTIEQILECIPAKRRKQFRDNVGESRNWFVRLREKFRNESDRKL